MCEESLYGCIHSLRVAPQVLKVAMQTTDEQRSTHITLNNWLEDKHLQVHRHDVRHATNTLEQEVARTQTVSCCNEMD